MQMERAITPRPGRSKLQAFLHRGAGLRSLLLGAAFVNISRLGRVLLAGLSPPRTRHAAHRCRVEKRTNTELLLLSAESGGNRIAQNES